VRVGNLRRVFQCLGCSVYCTMHCPAFLTPLAVRRPLCRLWQGLTNSSPDTESDGPGRTAVVVQTRGGTRGGVCGDPRISIWRGPRAFAAKPARIRDGNYSCERVVVEGRRRLLVRASSQRWR
jgi:hypothetical protein